APEDSGADERADELHRHRDEAPSSRHALQPACRTPGAADVALLRRGPRVRHADRAAPLREEKPSRWGGACDRALGSNMRDFPPEISVFYSAPGRMPGPAPDTRSPAAFLRWILRLQWQVILLTTAMGVLWQLPAMLGPWLFGKAVDEGIDPGSLDGTLKYAGL